MPLQLIGAGFGRTGTLSLKVALEQLGLKPCFHMDVIARQPTRAKAWYEISTGKVPDWEKLLGDYQACVDWPCCTYYRELMAAYPEAKVLLNVRDPESWYASMRDTTYAMRPQFPTLLKRMVPFLRYIPAMLDSIIWEGTFQGKFLDKAHTLQVYHAHIEEVKRIVPPEKLLVYHVKEGWEPLCQFLEVPVPEDTPFPHLNDKASFIKAMKRNALMMQVVPVVGIILTSMLILSIVWLLFSACTHQPIR